MKVAIINIKAGGFTFLLLVGLISSVGTHQAAAQSRGENLDEAKVAAYTLPDPLMGENDKNITSAKEWTKTQRQGVLQLFKEHVYGKLPAKPKGLHFQVNSVDEALR